MSAASGPLRRTPSQTIGPFFGFALPWPEGPFVVPQGTSGGIWVRGRLTDGRGDPLPDALVETWQADPDGHVLGPPEPGSNEGSTGAFRGFGRCPTDPDGRYAIFTLKPGGVPAPRGGLQAPHIDVSVFARGLLKRLVTRIYFADEAAANARDPILGLVADPSARATLVAERIPDGYRFDIRLQGDGEGEPQVAATPAEGYAASCEAVAGADLRPDLGAVRAPVLCIAASADPALAVEDVAALAAGLPRGRLEVVERAAHLVNVERPRKVTALLLEHMGVRQ